jgi:hypothetical protein
MLTGNKLEPNSGLLAGQPVKNLLIKVFSWSGLALLLFTTLGWLLTFPMLTLLEVSLTRSGYYNPALYVDRPLPPLAEFFRDYPQVLWLGFALGAALFFGARPLQIPTASPSKNERLQLWQGKEVVLPAWVNRLWRYSGILCLGLILVLAAIFRIVNAREIGATDLIRTDYDEGVHASAALLLSDGKAVYRDFFLTQPPVGPFLWSIPLRLHHDDWGGLLDFLRLRLFTSLVALVTIGLVYLTGRRLGGRWAGPLAGAIAALTLAVDGSAIRTEQQIMLEPLINLFTVAAICVFVHYRPALAYASRLEKFGLPALAGIFAGLALSVKIPALAVGLALLLTLLIWRQWRASLFYLGGLVLGYLLASGYFLVTVGPAFMKEAYLYQLLRPFNRLAVTGEFQPETTLTAFDYLTRTPYIAFTLLGAMLGLLAIVLRWATGKGGENWLPVVLLAVFTGLLYTGKAGFFPHYYDHLALPLALLAGGVVNFWQPEWWRSKLTLPLSLAGTVLVALALLPALQRVGDNPSKPEWSEERALVASFQNLGLNDDAPTLTWDARYSFILSTPLPTDAYNQYLVDSAAYVEYLALGFGEQNLATVAKKAVFENSKTVSGDMRQLRYTPKVQQDLYKTALKAMYIIIEPRAESQLTPQTDQLLKRNFINRLDSRDLDVFSNSTLIRYQSGALFGDKMRLVGFDTTSQVKSVAGANKLPLTLFWRGEAKIDEDYVIFIHLLNQDGQIVAQRDTAPRYGALDTSKWNPGELLDDDQSLDLPPNLPAGSYRIEMGVYRPTDGKRLTLTTDPPQPKPTDSLILTEIKIGS